MTAALAVARCCAESHQLRCAARRERALWLRLLGCVLSCVPMFAVVTLAGCGPRDCQRGPGPRVCGSRHVSLLFLAPQPASCRPFMSSPCQLTLTAGQTWQHPVWPVSHSTCRAARRLAVAVRLLSAHPQRMIPLARKIKVLARSAACCVGAVWCVQLFVVAGQARCPYVYHVLADACAVVVICLPPHPCLYLLLAFLHSACVVLQPACVGLSLGCVLCPCVLGIPCRHHLRRSVPGAGRNNVYSTVCSRCAWMWLGVCVLLFHMYKLCLPCRACSTPAGTAAAHPALAMRQQHSPSDGSTCACADGAVLTAGMRSTHQPWCACAVDCIQAQHISLDVQRRALDDALSCMHVWRVCGSVLVCVLDYSGCGSCHGYHLVWLSDGPWQPALSMAGSARLGAPQPYYSQLRRDAHCPAPLSYRCLGRHPQSCEGHTLMAAAHFVLLPGLFLF